MTVQTRSDSSSLLQFLRWGPAALAAVAFATLTAYYRFHIGDDGYIYFRYVANLIAGHGPVWNMGETPVEGYSSPLWLGLLSVGAALGLDIVEWSRWAGIVAAAVALIGVWALARRIGAGVFVSGLAVLFASLVRGVYFWAPAALETPLDTALMVWACVFLATPKGRGWILPVALLGIARPEGPFVIPLAVLALALARGRSGLEMWEVAVVFAPTAAWMAFRLAYYGVPLPNTYYAKATGALIRQLRLGLEYGGLAMIPLGAIFFAWWRRAPREPILAAWLLIGGQLGVTILGGGDWMRNHRLLLPVLLPLIGCAVGLAGSGGARYAFPTALTVVVLIPDLVSPRTFPAALRGETLPVAAWQEASLIPVSQEISVWIAKRYPPGSTIAVNHAGVVPSELPSFHAIDMTGLNDAHIAREVSGGLHQKYDPDYVLSRRPDLILLNSRVEPGIGGLWYHPGYWEGETALIEREEFRRWYRPVRSWTRIGHAGEPAYVLLFERIPARGDTSSARP